MLIVPILELGLAPVFAAESLGHSGEPPAANSPRLPSRPAPPRPVPPCSTSRSGCRCGRSPSKTSLGSRQRWMSCTCSESGERLSTGADGTGRGGAAELSGGRLEAGLPGGTQSAAALPAAPIASGSCRLRTHACRSCGSMRTARSPGSATPLCSWCWCVERQLYFLVCALEPRRSASKTEAGCTAASVQRCARAGGLLGQCWQRWRSQGGGRSSWGGGGAGFNCEGPVDALRERQRIRALLGRGEGAS